MKLEALPVPLEMKPLENQSILLFLEHASLFTPEQRERVLKLLEYTILPKYKLNGNVPLEEEWLNRTKGVKVVETK